MIEVVRRCALELRRGRSKRVVDGAAQLVSDYEVDDEGRGDHRERNGGGGDQSEAGTEGHRPPLGR